MTDFLGALDRTIQKAFIKNSNTKDCDMRAMSGGWQQFSGILDLVDLRLERMYSSGNKNDCLMHAFMNATIPSFRKLCEAKKNEVADMFRRRKFLEIAKDSQAFKRQTAREQASVERRINSKEYLENLEVTMLCEYYSIKIMVFELLKQDTLTIPSTVIYGLRAGVDRDTDPVYMLYNPGQYHFEAVRNIGTNTYTIPLATANAISEMFMSSVSANVSGCKFSIGEKVVYRGEEYYVIDRKFGRNTKNTRNSNETKCLSFTLSKNASAVNRIKNAQKAKMNSTSINALISEFTELVVKPEELLAANAHS